MKIKRTLKQGFGHKNNFNKTRKEGNIMLKSVNVIPTLLLSALGLVILSSSVAGRAAFKESPEVSIFVDNKEVEQTANSGMAYITNNRTMVPLRVVTENMGFKVKWDNDTKKATIEGEESTVVIGLDSKKALVNGKTVTLDATSTMKDQRTYVPLRFVSEALGSKVEYANKRVDITLGAGTGITPPVTTPQTPSTNGFVGVNGMTSGTDYKLNQVFSNAQDIVNKEWFDLVAVREDNYNTANIIVKKGTWGKTNVNGVVFYNVGWDSKDPIGLASKITGTVKEHIQLYYIEGSKVIGTDTIDKDDIWNGYVYFGDVLGNTPTNVRKATHIAFATMESGEVAVYEMPTTLPTLNIYSK